MRKSPKPNPAGPLQPRTDPTLRPPGPAPRGWTWLYNATKWHYFVDNRSLCGRYLLLEHGVGLDDTNDAASENCAECRRRVAKLRAGESRSSGTPTSD